MKRSGRTRTPPSRWLLAQSRNDCSRHCSGSVKRSASAALIATNACAKRIDDGAVTARQGGSRIGADAEHQPLVAAEPSIERPDLAAGRDIGLRQHLADSRVAADASQRAARNTRRRQHAAASDKRTEAARQIKQRKHCYRAGRRPPGWSA